MSPFKKNERNPQRSTSLPNRKQARSGSVRIIGGQWKKTPLIVADIEGLRPTGDRVRETLFNWLRHFFGSLEHCQVLDMFAGSGALGFEAASRGAKRVLMFEKNRIAAQALRQSQQKLKAEMIEVRCADSILQTRELAERFDIIFIDPPFALNLHQKAVQSALSCLKPNGMIYMESDKKTDPNTWGALGLQLQREQISGNVAYRLYQYTLKEDRAA